MFKRPSWSNLPKTCRTATVTKINFQLHTLTSSQWKSWDKFVLESPQGTVFQTTPYLNAFSEAFQRKVEILTAFENDEIVAGVVLLPKMRGGLKYATSPYLIPFNGILIKDVSSIDSYFKKVKYQQRALELLQGELERRFHFCELNLSSRLFDLRSFIWQNWQIQPDYTIYIPLQDPTDPIDSIQHNQRRHLRKFEKSSFTFGEFSDFKICYDLMNQSYRHHAVKPPIGQEAFQKFSSALLSLKLSLKSAYVRGVRMGLLMSMI